MPVTLPLLSYPYWKSCAVQGVFGWHGEGEFVCAGRIVFASLSRLFYCLNVVVTWLRPGAGRPASGVPPFSRADPFCFILKG
jgi:hypothetical protein